MDSQALIELAIKLLSCTQKELANQLSVSPTQISKWKRGEYISSEMQEKLKNLLNIDELHPEFILMAGSLEDAKKWDHLIHRLADLAYDSAETGYDTEPLQDDLQLLSLQTFHTLQQMGTIIPTPFPSELDLDDEDLELLMESVEDHPVANLIWNIFLALNDVYGFYSAYIYEYMFDSDLDDLFESPAANIEPCLMELAACKLKISIDIAPNFENFKYKTIGKYTEWLNIVKDKVIRANIPLKNEILKLTYQSLSELSYEADAESLGLNEQKIHPDIYMNELLIGMRTIHQVLPIIMKKLEIYDEFKLDQSDFKLGN